MLSKIARAFFLAISILAIYIWATTPSLNIYNLQLTGALILLYFVSKFFFRGVKPSFYLETVVLTSITLLLVFSTGGTGSPIFFVLDFLLFAVALLLAPFHAVVASAVLVGIFFWESYPNISSLTIINGLSLVLITPLAIIFSKTYLKNLESEGKISVLQEAIKDEHVDNLLWISTTAKPSIATVLNATTDLVIFFNSKGQELKIPNALIEKIKTIQRDLIALYSSTNILEKSIEDASDKMEL